MSKIELYNEDCMIGMAKYPDKYFELAIVDPPYGINKDGQVQTTGGHGGRKAHEKKRWDICIEKPIYFDELKRVSQNQIIWGANYMVEYLKPSMGWIFWDKGQDINQSDGELAYSNFNRALRRIILNRVELLKEGTIHPTQKPVKLYEWLLKNYAKPGDKILDTHFGSGSIAIACWNMNHDLIGFELDKDYYEAACKRLEEHKKQQRMF
jgi:site-specific DNA-methyltransferase (adenine-specific)